MYRKNDTAILIPSRYGSERLPGKPLISLGGKPLVKHVYDTCKSTGYDTFVLTDDERILSIFDEDCLVDFSYYDNGTERCCGALGNFFQDTNYDKFINVQGDMIDVSTECIERCLLSLNDYSVSTVFTDMPKEKQDDPNTVKLIRSGDNCPDELTTALWFGRGLTGYGDWHLGVYGYTLGALESYNSLRVSDEERVEKLEQLRWLKNGIDIGCLRVDYSGVEINTLEDVHEWESNIN